VTIDRARWSNWKGHDLRYRISLGNLPTRQPALVNFSFVQELPLQARKALFSRENGFFSKKPWEKHGKTMGL